MLSLSMVCLTKTNGERWHELYGQMLVLLQCVQPPFPWEPSALKHANFVQTYDAWRAVEKVHHDAIYAAARELATTGRLQSMTAEVHYFLCHRILDVTDGLRGTFTCHDGKSVSIVPFPNLSMEEVAEWYLTVWADYHTAGQVIREEDFEEDLS